MAGAADDRHTRYVWTDEEATTTPGIQPAFSQQHHPAGQGRGIRAKNQGQISSGGHKPLEDIWLSDPLHIQTLYSTVNRFDYCHQRSVEIRFSLFYFQPDIPESFFFFPVRLIVCTDESSSRFLFPPPGNAPPTGSHLILWEKRGRGEDHTARSPAILYTTHRLTVRVCVCVFD